ncbi:MAG: hypothetical protein IJ583_01910 [Firmicutes bacterium]|nr:hypothetical protein [Bacillota bacterium]
MEKIEEIIERLYNKGYSYTNIRSFLLNYGIYSKTGKPFTKSNIRYYIRKYNIQLRKCSDIELNEIYFKKDRYYCLLNKYFKPGNYKYQLYNMKNMLNDVKNTKLILSDNEYVLNVNNYNKIVEKLQKKEKFKVYNKRIRGDYTGRNLLAIGLDHKGKHSVILKKDIFDWMREKDQFILHTKNEEISLRGMICTSRIFLTINKGLELDDFLRYIYIPSDSSELKKEEVCSEDSFKIAVNKNGDFRLVEVRIKGELKLPQFTVFEDELYRRIKSNYGVKSLTYSDMHYVSSLYENLKNDHVQLKNTNYIPFFI